MRKRSTEGIASAAAGGPDIAIDQQGSERKNQDWIEESNDKLEPAPVEEPSVFWPGTATESQKLRVETWCELGELRAYLCLATPSEVR